MSKKLVLIGGGEIRGWSFKTKDSNQELYQTEKIDKSIVKLSDKSNPKLLFIGTASRENEIYYEAIKKIYTNLGCDVDCLKMNDEKLNEKVLNSDIIYIGGGNTKFMLSEWEKVNLKDILLDAYNKGIIVAGFSAGSYCWFKYNYEKIEGFGLINSVICVHYDEKSEEKRNEFYNTIKNTGLSGIALDNGVAIKYSDNNFEIIKSIENAKGYRIVYKDGEYLEEELFENINYQI